MLLEKTAPITAADKIRTTSSRREATGACTARDGMCTEGATTTFVNALPLASASAFQPQHRCPRAWRRPAQPCKPMPLPMPLLRTSNKRKICTVVAKSAGPQNPILYVSLRREGGCPLHCPLWYLNYTSTGLGGPGPSPSTRTSLASLPLPLPAFPVCPRCLNTSGGSCPSSTTGAAFPTPHPS